MEGAAAEGEGLCKSQERRGELENRFRFAQLNAECQRSELGRESTVLGSATQILKYSWRFLFLSLVLPNAAGLSSFGSSLY